MSLSSEIISGLRLVWKTVLPSKKGCSVSFVFSFLDADWSLEMLYNDEFYSVYVSKITSWNDFQPFEIITCIKREGRQPEYRYWFRQTVTFEFKLIWCKKKADLLEEIPELKDSRDFTIVCILHTVPPSDLTNDSIPEHQSIQESLEFPPDLESLSHDLGNLLEKGVIPDVELKCGDSTAQAHRAVLAARSEVFSDIFRNKKTASVEVPQMQFEVLDLLLKYVYTGKLAETSGDLVPRLYEASDEYAVKGLKKACSKWMTGKLTEENCLSFLVLADTHNDVDFKNEVVRFVYQNKEILENEAWSRFADEHPRLAIKVYHGITFPSKQ